MANIKSAKKRILLNEERRLRNRSVRSRVKTAVKRFELSQAAEVQESFRKAVAQIDKAVTKGVLHKNTAARKKSQLARNLKVKVG